MHNCPLLLPLPPQHPLQRGVEGLITALSRNWSMFNSSGGLTGTSTKRHLTVLSKTLAALVAAAVAAVTNSFSQNPQTLILLTAEEQD